MYGESRTKTSFRIRVRGRQDGDGVIVEPEQNQIFEEVLEDCIDADSNPIRDSFKSFKIV